MDGVSDVQRISVDAFDLSCQTRAALDQGAVADYSAHLTDSEDLPAVIAYRAEDGTLYLSSGFHRREAYRRAGRRTIPTWVREGSKWDAMAFGVMDNAGHIGVRLSRADKRAAAERLLRERPEASDVVIAKAACTTDKTVARVRAGLEATSEIPRLDSRVGADGRTRSAPSAVASSHAGDAIVSLEVPNDGPVTVGAEVPMPASLRAAVERLSDKHRPEFERNRRLDSDSDRARAAMRAWLDLARNHPELRSIKVDACRCGGEWGPDGEGGRYCEKCGAEHPENPSTLESEPRSGASSPGEPGGSIVNDRSQRPPKPREDYFREAMERLGAFKRAVGDANTHFPNERYRAVVKAADAAGSELAG